MSSDVKDLLAKISHMTPKAIAEALGNRVSPRTIYRWAKGQSQPQQKADIDALVKLVETESAKTE